MQLSVKTIETYPRRIKEKLGLTTSADLVRRAHGWLLETAREHGGLKRLLAGKRARSLGDVWLVHLLDREGRCRHGNFGAKLRNHP